MELVTWRGTPGVGDFMWALNCVHLHAYRNNTKVKLQMHWDHGPDHLHHFEDPETIIERMDYIHNFYHRKDDVVIDHLFYAEGRYSDWTYKDDLSYEDGIVRVKVPDSDRDSKKRFWFESGAWSDERGSPAPDNDWLFRQDAFRQIDPKKIVIWTPTQNAEVPRPWKRKLTDYDWRVIIKKLRQAGLNVIELGYRTPVREAMYHISTCRQVICYDGMWHYVAKNFARPMMVISKEGVTKYHTDYAVRVNPDYDGETNIWWWMDNLNQALGHTKKKAMAFETKMKTELKYE
jgi:hypothetical protein